MTTIVTAVLVLETAISMEADMAASFWNMMLILGYCQGLSAADGADDIEDHVGDDDDDDDDDGVGGGDAHHVAGRRDSDDDGEHVAENGGIKT